jgi:hypothetical protein
MYVNVVWIFLILAMFIVLAITAIPFSIYTLSQRVRRVGRSRH